MNPEFRGHQLLPMILFHRPDEQKPAGIIYFMLLSNNSRLAKISERR